MSATTHHCHAHGCTKTVPPRMLMCLKHWRMVPLVLQNSIWRTYVPGQEVSPLLTFFGWSRIETHPDGWTGPLSSDDKAIYSTLGAISMQVYRLENKNILPVDDTMGSRQ